MEQQSNPQPKSSQQVAYKRVLTENKRLKEQLARQEKELERLRAFIGIGDRQ